MLLCTITLPRVAAALMSALLVLAMPAGPVAAQGPSYLADVDDLPLAPGLIEDMDAGVAFDKPEGRIVQAVASGRVDPAGVRAFYAETLPALGWQPGADGTWARGAEVLRVNVETKDGGAVVRYAIAPGTP
ncbi:MAG: hypothetical protein ABJ215_05490 [Alphaproteobacteria bacterium]